MPKLLKLLGLNPRERTSPAGAWSIFHFVRAEIAGAEGKSKGCASSFWVHKKLQLVDFNEVMVYCESWQNDS
jgi:hypothetical protein